VVADAGIDSEEIAGRNPVDANAEVDVADVTLGEENHQLLNLIDDTATGNEVRRHKTRGTYTLSVALRYLRRGCVDRGSEDSTSDGEEPSGEHPCEG
jgi:hypothetical protein